MGSPHSRGITEGSGVHKMTAPTEMPRGKGMGVHEGGVIHGGSALCCVWHDGVEGAPWDDYGLG